MNLKSGAFRLVFVDGAGSEELDAAGEANALIGDVTDALELGDDDDVDRKAHLELDPLTVSIELAVGRSFQTSLPKPPGSMDGAEEMSWFWVQLMSLDVFQTRGNEIESISNYCQKRAIKHDNFCKKESLEYG